MKSFDNFIDLAKKESICLKYAQLWKGDELVAEWSDMPVKTRLNVWSVSKSFVSAGVGIAIDEGLMTLDEKIVDSFPDYVNENTSENLKKATVRDLLTMRSGLDHPLFFGDWPERYTVKDWIKHFFDAKFPHEPGTHFLYSNFNTYILSCMIERKAKVQNTLYYLRDKLLEPIGITNPEWTLCPMGHIYAANGLYLTIDELSKFGRLMLHKGNWNGKQIVSASYVEEATKKHSDSKPAPGGGEIALAQGYGYQFWMNQVPGTFCASGNFGQGCIIAPEQNAVFSYMSLEGNKFGILADAAPEVVRGA